MIALGLGFWVRCASESEAKAKCLDDGVQACGRAQVSRFGVCLFSYLRLVVGVELTEGLSSIESKMRYIEALIGTMRCYATIPRAMVCPLPRSAATDDPGVTRKELVGELNFV